MNMAQKTMSTLQWPVTISAYIYIFLFLYLSTDCNLELHIWVLIEHRCIYILLLRTVTGSLRVFFFFLLG